VFNNKVSQVLDSLCDGEGNLYYLISFKPSKDRWFEPQWVWFLVALQIAPDLIARYHVETAL
jgi:hypothetical protein